MKCPRCDGELETEIYEGVEIDRCLNCQGKWLDSEELTKIIVTKEKTFSPELIHEALVSAYSGVPEDESRTILKCPKCQTAMRSINYDYKSGVIIDSCPRGHGTWFDKDELEKVQIHREYWDKQINEHEEEWLALARSVAEDKEKIMDENRKRNMRPTKYLVNSMIRKVLGK